jgi:hypothetical protein
MSSTEVSYTSPILVLEPTTCAEMILRRRESGGDHHDE